MLRVFRAGSADYDLARKAVTDIHKRQPFEEVGLKQFLADPSNYLILALWNDQIAGSLNGYKLHHPNRQNPQFLLYEVDVREESRNQGIGKKLVEAFNAEARKEGSFEIWVLTNEDNPAALRMYSSCGFQRINPDDVMLSIKL